MQHVSQPPLPDLSGLSLEQLRDLIEMQQRTIGFLIGQYNDLMEMVDDEQGRAFGPIVSVASGAAIGAGWWQTVTPASGPIATVMIGATGTPPTGGTSVVINAGPFWSDGKMTATAALTLSRIAVRPAS